MKTREIMMMILALLVAAGCGNGKRIVITGQVTGEAGERQLVYTVPVDGTCHAGFTDTARVAGDTGAFTLEFEAGRPVFMKFRLAGTGSVKPLKLLLEPGNRYRVTVDAATGDILPAGRNAKGQLLLAALPDPEFVEMDTRVPRGDTSLAAIHETIARLKREELAPFKALLDTREISPAFHDAVAIDRDCYHAALEAIRSLERLYRGGNSPGDSARVMENLEGIHARHPVNDPALTASTSWNYLARHHVQGYRLFAGGKTGRVRGWIQGDSLYTCLFNEARACLDGKALEFYLAGELYFTAIQKNFERELVALFEQFKQDYPRSGYTRFLEPVIRPVVAYHERVARPLDDRIVFVDICDTDDGGNSGFNTLEDATGLFKGKKIYIDIWASWCAPCKQEFAHVEALQEILAAAGVQMLYISIDDYSRERQWLENINYYNLVGTHVRANPAFTTDLVRRFDKKDGISIPWYILVDERGNVIEEHAREPSRIVEEGRL
jgi:thiol-disulfide isomerase/thioredoxin